MMKLSIMKTEFQNLDELKDRLNLLRQNHSEKMAKAFEITIHPFIDGNGQTARLLMNFNSTTKRIADRNPEGRYRKPRELLRCFGNCPKPKTTNSHF